MTPSRSHRRPRLSVAVLVVVGVLASACGGGDADSSGTPATPAETHTTQTPAATPSPTSAPTTTVTPLSRFEDRPEVQALRSWAAASAQDVNARHHDFPLARQFQVDSADVRKDVAFSWHEDFDKYYPGPLPFTPVAVSRSGRRSEVTACVIGTGFSLTKPGGKRAEKRGVIATMFTMVKQGDSWLLAGIVAGTADCKGVRIAPVPW